MSKVLSNLIKLLMQRLVFELQDFRSRH